MKEKYKTLFKNTGILSISNFSSKILSFFLVPLYTSILSTEEYGNYDLVISTCTLLYPILTLNIVECIMRFFLDNKTSKRKVVSIALKYSLISFFIVGFFLALNFYFGFVKAINGFEFLIFFYYVFYLFNNFSIQYAKGFENIWCLGVAGVVGTTAMLGFNVLFLVVVKMGLKGFFLANILGQAIPTLYIMWKLKIWRFLSFKIDGQLQHDMLSYSIPLIMTSLGWWMNSSFDKYIVTLYCGLSISGLVSIAYKIPNILSILQSMFIQAWQVSAIVEYGKEDSNFFYENMFNIFNSLVCIPSAILICTTKIVSRIIYSSAFFNAWKYVPLLIVSLALNASSSFIGPILSAKKDSRTMAISAFYGTVLNILLNLILVKIYGAQGAIAATVISSLVIYIIRRHSVKNEIKSIFYHNIILSWIVLTIQALLLICDCWFGYQIVAVIFELIIYRLYVYKIFMFVITKSKSLSLH